MLGISKEIFLNAAVCPTKGWYLRSIDGAADPTEAELFRMEQGQNVGQLARTLYHDGILVQGEDASEQTQSLITDPNTTALFEATFNVDDYTAKADILQRQSDGWHVIEVKSSLEDTARPKMEQLIYDLTYTVMVLKRCFVHVRKASLLLIARDYRLGMPAEKVFVEIDQTNAVEDRLTAWNIFRGDIWNNIRFGTAQEERPDAQLIRECRTCEFFANDCLGKGIEYSVFDLPMLHRKKVAQLSEDGIVDLRSIPDGFPLIDTHQRVVDSVDSGKPYISKTLKEDLDKVEWSAHYLDFETVMTALPLYPDVAPFEQILTQYSIHHCSALGKVIEHDEFLADADRDCQRELAERLIDDLGDSGSIIVYSPFEKTRIGAFQKRFPDLADHLERLKGRLFDLMQVIRRGYYHPDFYGSYSIKQTLPVLVPEMKYEGMEIGDGDTAIARFARMAMGEYSAAEIGQVRAALLEYCGQDTMAMVRLHVALDALAHAG